MKFPFKSFERTFKSIERPFKSSEPTFKSIERKNPHVCHTYSCLLRLFCSATRGQKIADCPQKMLWSILPHISLEGKAMDLKPFITFATILMR